MNLGTKYKLQLIEEGSEISNLTATCPFSLTQNFLPRPKVQNLYLSGLIRGLTDIKGRKECVDRLVVVHTYHLNTREASLGHT